MMLSVLQYYNTNDLSRYFQKKILNTVKAATLSIKSNLMKIFYVSLYPSIRLKQVRSMSIKISSLLLFPFDVMNFALCSKRCHVKRINLTETWFLS